MMPPGYESATADEINTQVRERLNFITKNKAWPLLLHGPVGTGKTCAAAVIYGSVLGHRPIWHRADDLLLSMSHGRSNGLRVESQSLFGERVFKVLTWEKFADRIARASCLFLDDLAVRRPTEQMQQSLFDLLEWRKNRPLVITSNKSPAEIGELYDDRIRSRLTGDGASVIEFSGPDRRRGTGYYVKVEAGT